MSWFPRLAPIFAACALAAPMTASVADAATRVPLTHVHMSSKATAKAKATNPARTPIACAAKTTRTARYWRAARTGRLTTHPVKGPGRWVVRRVSVHAKAAACITKTTNASTTSSTTAKTAAPPSTTSSPSPTLLPITGAGVAPGALNVGINANTQGWGTGAPQMQDKVMKTGVRWLREELDWNVVEGAPGQFDWSRYDLVYASAAARGMTVLPLIVSTPAWAGATETTIPTDPTSYANFASHVVKRYGPGGAFWAAHPELPAVPSSWYEIWNEPYVPVFSAGHPDAGTYARLVAAAGAAVHAANPAAKVLLGTDIDSKVVNGRSESWTDQMYDAVPALNQYFDGVVVHPYSISLTTTTDDYYGRFIPVMVNVRNDFVGHGAQDKGFWLTEIGWATCPGGAAAHCVSEADQAALVTQLFSLLHTTYASYVRGVFLYHYNDQPNGTANDPEAYFGLTRADGSPKPAFAALQAAIAATSS